MTISEKYLGIIHQKLKMNYILKVKLRLFFYVIIYILIKDQESLVLNFHGRVSLPSTKNFQIIEGGNLENPNSSNNIVLQFGKAKKDEFIIDFQYPFCPLQAFAFCLSALDKKLGLR